MERTDLLDTSPWAHKEIVRRLRLLTPEQRLKMAFDLTDLGGRIHRAALRELTADRKHKGCDIGE